jgi:hypothetical protein
MDDEHGPLVDLGTERPQVPARGTIGDMLRARWSPSSPS